MKFDERIADMTVQQIIEKMRKHIQVLTWEEEVLFFKDANERKNKQTLLDWEVCKNCISKCKSVDNRKELDLKAWVNMHKWTENFSKESFLKYLITNFFDEEKNYCTEKAWAQLHYVIDDAFKLIAEENEKG